MVTFVMLKSNTLRFVVIKSDMVVVREKRTLPVMKKPTESEKIK